MSYICKFRITSSVVSVRRNLTRSRRNRLKVLLLLTAASALGQIPGNVMSRVFEIRVGKAIGTSFFVPVNGKEYLFTANHVVEGVGEQGDIELLNNNQWQALNVRVIHADSRCNDVAVLILKPKAWTVNADPLVSTHSLFVGQEIYFLGFPYGLVVQANNYNWTFPLVKHGYTSAVAKCSDIETGAPSEKELILLDGFNNPGFSEVL